MLNFYEFYMLMEQEETQPILSGPQNQAIKQLYVQIFGLVQAYIDAGKYPSKEAAGALNFTKSGGKYHFNNIKDFQKLFPAPIADDFHVRFQDGNSQLESIDGIKTRIKISLDRIRSGNIPAIKTTIQHELQHFVSKGGNIEDEKNATVSQYIDYLTIPGEVTAHAKESAYYFHKLFPDEQQFDLNKVVENITDEKKKAKLGNYVKFKNDAKGLSDKHGLGEEYIGKMQTAGNQFYSNAQWFLDNSFRAGQSQPAAAQQQVPQQQVPQQQAKQGMTPANWKSFSNSANYYDPETMLQPKPVQQR
jgi:hypothetical protein